MKFKGLLAHAALLLAVLSNGQVPSGQAPSPKFEIVSIKPTNPAVPPPRGPQQLLFPGGRYSNRHASVFALLEFAYPENSVPNVTLIGLPDWAYGRGHVTFDVEAQPPVGMKLGGDNLRLMMRALLTERFRFRAHFETRSEPVYFLAKGAQAPRHIHLTKNQMDPGQAMQLGIGWQHMSLDARGVSMADLCSRLAPHLGRPVIDRTGLVGYYDIDLPMSAADRPEGGNRDFREIVIDGIKSELGLDLISGS